MKSLDVGLRLTVYRPQVPLDSKYPLAPLPGLCEGFDELVVVGTRKSARDAVIAPLDPLYRETEVTENRPAVILEGNGALIPLAFFDGDGRRSLPPRMFSSMMRGVYAGSLGIRWKFLTNNTCGKEYDLVPIYDSLVSLEEFYDIDAAAKELGREFRSARDALANQDPATPADPGIREGSTE